MSSRRLIIPFLILLCLLAYSSSFRAGFHFDDYRMIRFNFPAHGDSGWASILRYDRYRPLLLASFALNYSFAKQNPLGYHLVNLSLHALCVVLFYLLLNRSAARRLFTVIAAGLMAVHPLNTEAVTYIAGRSIVLCAIFYLAALLFADSFFRKKSRPASILFFICFALAALSKEEAAMIPLAVLLYNLIYFGRDSVRKHRLFHFLTFIPLAGGIILRGSALPRSSYGYLQYWSAQPIVWWRYVSLALYPVGQNVDPDIHVPGFANIWVWSALLLSAAAVVLLWRLRRKSPMPAFWGIWFFLNLLPSSVVPLNDLMAEHRAYLSLFGFCATAAYGIGYAAERGALRPRIIAIVFILIMVFFATLTFERNRVWQNEFTLWYDAVHKSPAKPRAHMNLAGAYIQNRAYDKATSEYLQARRIGGEAPEIYSGLGICAFQQRDFETAEKYFRLGLQLNHQHTDSRAGLALVLYRQKRFQEALPHLEAVYPLRQESPAIIGMLANCYIKLGQSEKAGSLIDRLGKLGYVSEAKKLKAETGK